MMAENLRSRSLLPLVVRTDRAQAHRMLLITCPVTRTDELVADQRIRAITNHPTHLAMHVSCPACGGVHVYRTGRRWEQTRARATARSATASALAAEATTARAARVDVPA
jgi:hypothetical protein